MMTSAQVVETSVTTTDNSLSQDYTHPDDQITLLHNPSFPRTARPELNGSYKNKQKQNKNKTKTKQNKNKTKQNKTKTNKQKNDVEKLTGVSSPTCSKNNL